MGRLPLVLVLLTIVSPLLFCREARAGLCSEIISPYGYTCNEYQATTDDGFILGIQNILASGSPVASGLPVLLMHGLFGGGDNWVLNPPQQSLAFILADAGYDVWIGNNRCIQWSGGHTSYSSQSDGFWDWTYDELSAYDLKTLTEFVYNQRGQLFYVGHSQGGTMLLAGLTGGVYKSQVSGYLKGASLLAPASAVGHLSPTLTRAGALIYADKILPAIGVQDFDVHIFVNTVCQQEPSIPASVCENAFSGILVDLVGQDNYIDLSRFPYYNKYFPQSTSSYNVNHFGQSVRTDTFQFYDKGFLGNLAAYGQATPPSYDLSAFPSSLPLQVWSGGVDQLVVPTDVASLLGQLPSSNREHHYLPSYGHLDFVIGTQANSDIYPSIINFMKAHA